MAQPTVATTSTSAPTGSTAAPPSSAGAISSASPANPVMRPTATPREGRRPPRRIQSSTTTHSGSAPTTSAVSPDATRCSAHTTPPLPTSSSSVPMTAALCHCARVGAGAPRERAHRNSTPPATRNRTAAMLKGGMVSMAIAMARYVEPQMTYSAANAITTRHFSSRGIGCIPSPRPRLLHLPAKLRRFLQRTEHDGAARRAHLRNGAEPFLEDAREIFRIARPHLGQVAVLAGHVVDLLHLRHGGQLLTGVVGAGALVGANEHEGEQAQSRGFGREPRLVAQDDAPRLELANALQNGRRRHAELPRDVR